MSVSFRQFRKLSCPDETSRYKEIVLPSGSAQSRMGISMQPVRYSTGSQLQLESDHLTFMLKPCGGPLAPKMEAQQLLKVSTLLPSPLRTPGPSSATRGFSPPEASPTGAFSLPPEASPQFSSGLLPLLFWHSSDLLSVCPGHPIAASYTRK